MPTYKFKCKCGKEWSERQKISLDKSGHESSCPDCLEKCKSISFGGTGTQLKGRHLNKYLEGFPDQTERINSEAEKDGKEMEKNHDAYVAEQTRKEKSG